MKQNNKYFDIQYIHRLKDGDESAFEVVYEYYKNHVFYMGMQLFNRDRERAKDLVQNTFSEVYLNIGKLKSAEAFFVWMSQIAYRQGCNMLRYQSKDSGYYTTNVEEDFVEQYVQDDQQKDVLSELQRKEAIEIILEGLQEMDEDRRLVGYLRYFEELSLKEISEITGMPNNTIGSHLHRIKGKLKKQLEAKGFTSASCLSLLLVPNLISYFHAFVSLDEPLGDHNVDKVKQNVESEVKKQKNNSWISISKVVLGLAIVIPVGVIGYDKATTSLPVNNLENPAITAVQYNKKLTNKPVKIEVETDSINYDAILLDNTTDLVVVKNGTYEIQLMKDGKVTDATKITINNIDRDVPIVTNEVFEEAYIIFTIQDEQSGVNFENIKFLVNGIESSDFTIDKNKGSVKVPFFETKDSKLVIEDIAKNILDVNINSYKISAN